jgi:hypothetical protein
VWSRGGIIGVIAFVAGLRQFIHCRHLWTNLD